MSSSLTLVACISTVLLLTSSLDAVQDTSAASVPTLASLDLPLAQLKDSRQEFDYRDVPPGSSGPPVALGTIVLDTKVDAGKYTFEDRGDGQADGKPFWIEMSVRGAVGNELRPESLSVRSSMKYPDGKTYEFSADFTASAARVTFDDQTREVAVPAGTLCVEQLYRLGPLLPRRAGFVASYEHYLDANEMVVKPGGTIECASAAEEIQRESKAVKAFRFDVTSEGRVVFSMWIDDAGRLVQTCLDGRKWLVAKG
ncbi:MAG TPA: hypothetical protein VFY71_09655 [Planctomycetota bacterium]|nr:hypothetical protein [Planctomycetota bacterium]